MAGPSIARGREFTQSDDDTSPHVAVINEAMALVLWPNQDPIGKVFRVPSFGGCGARRRRRARCHAPHVVVVVGRPFEGPTPFVVGPAVLAIVGALASWLPARRAARMDPVRALRLE